jgi:hypothetical protein
VRIKLHLENLKGRDYFGGGGVGFLEINGMKILKLSTVFFRMVTKCADL